jgi:hypothetical protein
MWFCLPYTSDSSDSSDGADDWRYLNVSDTTSLTTSLIFYHDSITTRFLTLPITMGNSKKATTKARGVKAAKAPETAPEENRIYLSLIFYIFLCSWDRC